MPIKQDEVMIVNGRIRQIGFSFKVDKKCNRRAVFQCDCGNITIVWLHGGKTNTQSCGCLASELSRVRERKHGHTSGRLNGIQQRSKAYRVWGGIIERCQNPNNCNFHKYGERGITVCDRWRVFENFLEDMGEPPIGKSIERKNNDGNYYPENCVWATKIEQGRNKRNNRILIFDGKEMCLSAWEEHLGFPTEILSRRLSLGWSTERALTQPVRKLKGM